MFTGEADYRIRPNGVRVLLTPVSWAEEYEVEGSRVMTAPEGMVHDGASIPLAMSFLNGPSIQLAATLHDAAYRFHQWDNGDPMTRWEADRIILKASAVAQERARRNIHPIKRLVLTVSHCIQRYVIWVTLLPLGGAAWRAGPTKQENLDHEVLDEIHTILSALRLADAIAPTAT